MSPRTAFTTLPVPAAPDNALAPLALVGSMTSVCLGASFARALFPTLGAAGTVTLRIALAALLLVALHRPWRRELSRGDAAGIALYGLVLGLMNLCFYMAIRTVPLGLAIAVEFTGPLAVALAASRRAGDFLWIALAVAGLALLTPLAGASALDPVGVAFALAAAVFWALYILFGQRIGHLDGGQAVALGLGVGALAVLPFGIWGAGAALLQPSLLASGVLVAVLSSAVPYSLEIYALRHLPRQMFGVLLSLEPAIGALVGFLLLGQHLSLVQGLAIACIVAASTGSTSSAWRRRRAPRPAPDADHAIDRHR